MLHREFWSDKHPLVFISLDKTHLAVTFSYEYNANYHPTLGCAQTFVQDCNELDENVNPDLKQPTQDMWNTEMKWGHVLPSVWFFLPNVKAKSKYLRQTGCWLFREFASRSGPWTRPFSSLCASFPASCRRTSCLSLAPGTRRPAVWKKVRQKWKGRALEKSLLLILIKV